MRRLYVWFVFVRDWYPENTRKHENTKTRKYEKTSGETLMTFKALGLAGVAAVAVAIPAAAHHSFAMFDALKIVQLEGTVKEFQWTNPHAWILMNVKDEQGQSVQWAIEMNGPTGLA